MKDRINDPIPLIQHEVKHRRERLHHQVIKDLVESLYLRGYLILNYDHITLSIPKMNVSLENEGRRYDIVATDSEYLIYIEVKTRKIDKRKLEEGDKHG
jgi:hypothetical protein